MKGDLVRTCVSVVSLAVLGTAALRVDAQRGTLCVFFAGLASLRETPSCFDVTAVSVKRPASSLDASFIS